MERKYKISLLVVVLLAALLAVLDFTNPDKKSSVPERRPITSPTPVSPPREKPTTAPLTAAPTPLTVTPPSSTEEGLPSSFLKNLPYSGDGYYVEYFPTTKRLAVTIQNGSFSQKQTEVYGWLAEQGVKGAHSLDIIWSRNRRFVSD
jgi:hypothetical protein